MGRNPTLLFAVSESAILLGIRQQNAAAPCGESLHNHGCSHFHIFEKLFGHEVGHSNATVGCGVAGEVAGVHADGVVEAHEVGHGCRIIDLTWSDFVDSDVGTVVDDLSGGFVFDTAVEGGFVILVFLDDFVFSRRCAGIFFSRGDF